MLLGMRPANHAVACGLLATVALLSGSSDVRADDPLADGKLGVALGVTSAVGASSGDFGFGLVAATEAAYQPINLDSDWGWAVHWSAAYCWCSAASSASVTGDLRWFSMTLGGRIRRAMSRTRPRYSFLGIGAELLRSNVPVPPDDRRSYVGPYVSGGVEQYQSGGRSLVGFEVRYGMVATGPSNLSILLTFGFGN